MWLYTATETSTRLTMCRKSEQGKMLSKSDKTLKQRENSKPSYHMHYLAIDYKGAHSARDWKLQY